MNAEHLPACMAYNEGVEQNGPSEKAECICDEVKAKKCPCGGEFHFNNYCGAHVCTGCGQHKGLARCFCGWSQTAPGEGRRELQEMGETIDPEEG